MDTERIDLDSLDFWSFVDFAVSRAGRLLPGIDPAAMRVIQTMYRATSMVVYDMESTVHRPRGLSWPGFRVLFTVWLASPLEARKVAELTGMSRGAVSAVLATLERDGLVVKDRAPHDGRAVHVGLTERGQEVIAEVFQVQNIREQEWAGALTPQEQRTFVGLLEKIIASSGRIKAKHRS
ncbi:MarR family winged helix-turn-helix transcriptional regulator [Nonomuraea sp. NPDC049480]|uniref:MarR family winged helix-turn-helix transcriptional regulator n=1 Tax=Nonomuraea sp. NPDC049480 TaxID=3364353 RepID=UPI00378B2F3B